MKKSSIVAAVMAVLICGALVPVALGAAAGPTVKVQIKTLKKTLLPTTSVRGEKGWITKGGTPRGKCSGDSAAGALSAATHGRWTGKYYASVSGIFVTSILGVKPSGSDYWSVYVAGKPSSVGICSIKLHAGERLAFKRPSW
jgi:hypothetical protein